MNNRWPLAALEAIDVAAAVVDVPRREVVWRSAAWVALAGDGGGVAALLQREPGLAPLLQAQDRPAGAGTDAAPDADADAQAPTATRAPVDADPEPPTRADTVAIDRAGRRLDATRTLLGDGLVLLRLHDRGGLAQATQRHLEDRERLLFTSRLLSIGEMATTLAHEINQPIGAAANLLRGSVMRLQRTPAAEMRADEQAGLLQALQRATDQVLFASRVIARIREYTPSHSPRREPVDLVALLRGCVRLLDWEIERDAVTVVFDVPEAPLWTRADEVMLQQLFVNLMRNAIDALRANPPGARCLRLAARTEGPQVEVTVADNGAGISAEAEKTLFVPFASTKPTGTGIGLNICRSFVELHQGRLWFTRNTPAGTSFHAALPRLDPPPEDRP